MANNYWAERIAKSQTAITNKNIKQIEKQLRKYYADAAKQTIADFEAVYDKILAQQAAGKEITPADLYRMNKYWEMQGQLRNRLQKLGERQVSLLTKVFELNFFEVYYSFEIKGKQPYSIIDSAGARQLINSIWATDNKNFSARIWGNTEKLIETLNEELLHCVITGKKTSQLKNVLQERFGVSYSRADSLARTELAHVQTEAAKARYESYGITQVQIWADEDERRCDVCGGLHQKIYPTGAHVPIPAHPRCRCCIIPIVE